MAELSNDYDVLNEIRSKLQNLEFRKRVVENIDCISQLDKQSIHRLRIFTMEQRKSRLRRAKKQKYALNNEDFEMYLEKLSSGKCDEEYFKKLDDSSIIFDIILAFASMASTQFSFDSMREFILNGLNQYRLETKRGRRLIKKRKTTRGSPKKPTDIKEANASYIQSLTLDKSLVEILYQKLTEAGVSDLINDNNEFKNLLSMASAVALRQAELLVTHIRENLRKSPNTLVDNLSRTYSIAHDAEIRIQHKLSLELTSTKST